MYVFWALYQGLPGYLPVWAYAALGLLCVVLTMVALMRRAQSLGCGLLAVALLLGTTTHTSFALLGWDHLFQTCLLVWAAGLALSDRLQAQKAYLAVVLAALGVLYRPDGIFVALAIVGSLAWHVRRAKGAWVSVVAAFMLIGAGAALVNYLQFGHLTPTTARLKLGASPSIAYSMDYFVRNAWQRYSAGSLWVMLTLASWPWVRNMRMTHWTLLSGAGLSCVAAFVNSDVFSRMRACSGCRLA